MKNIMIEGTSMVEFQQKIEEIISTCLGQIEIREKENLEYLTRQQTADFLQVSLVTLNNWSKKKILTPHRMGNRVYYKMQDILNSMKPINNYKKTA